MDERTNDVSIHLDKALQERVRASAQREELGTGEALTALVYLGLEFAEKQRTGLREDLDDLQREIADVKQMLDVLGPSSVGVLRILTHWATQTGGLRVSEDELLAEGRLVAGEEWQGQRAERGIVPPGVLTGRREE
jgi:hypothetical protein